MDKGIKVGKYRYQKSTRPGKKLMTVVKGRTIHFGDSSLEHFKDKTGIWKSKDHNDKTRQKNYLTRSAGIKNKKGQLTKDNPESANYHARRLLW
tara:strand:- start:76 stop:357 length:282 start_codon:yes stop_codon:yes gene_type:complete